MIIGSLKLEIEIVSVVSLKDKRRVLNRVKDRVRNKFNVSIAEVDAHDLLNYACLGVVIVSNEQKFSNKVLSKVVDQIEDIRDCVLVDCSMNFIHSE